MSANRYRHHPGGRNRRRPNNGPSQTASSPSASSTSTKDQPSASMFSGCTGFSISGTVVNMTTNGIVDHLIINDNSHLLGRNRTTAPPQNPTAATPPPPA